MNSRMIFSIFQTCVLIFICFMSDCICTERNKTSIQMERNNTVGRTARVSIFHLVSQLSATDNCKVSSGLMGTCLSAQDCIKRGGRGIETCAWGLGMCCVYASSCGTTSTANMTYFTSPGYPNTWTSNSGVCSFTVRPKLFSKICQLKLDFEEFYIAGPTSGMCSTDLFAVNGQDLNSIAPVICGQNTGQHMYLQVSSSTGPFRFTVTTSGESDKRKWRIRITQIPCGSTAMAPPHCLQYYTGAVGRFQSFNYGNIDTNEDTYFLNMNYAICLRKEAAMCGAIFNAEGSFNVNVWTTTNQADACKMEYLSFGTDRKCGYFPEGKFNATKLGNTGPMVITFVSDDKHQQDASSSIHDTGFSFKYTQYSCSSGL